MCEGAYFMATNLQIDDHLLNAALKIGRHRTKKATVTEALKEYVQKRQQLKCIDLIGKIDFDPAYDYKKHRSRK